MNMRWQSPLASVADIGAQWRAVEDADIVEDTGSEASPQVLAWCDLSPLPRRGVKGVMQSPPPINGVQQMPAGELHCRLSEEEFLFLAAADGTLSTVEMETARVWLPRRETHCWLGLCGDRAAELLSLLCAVPLPVEGQLLQTRVAEVSVLLLSAPGASCPAYYLLAASGYALHVWESLTEAGAPYGGGAVGWRQWRDIFTTASTQTKS